ncbi:MAG: protein-L-isoaspartate(D-aspartate) O-methyltransferase, partial [Bryobacterales bacterium]
MSFAEERHRMVELQLASRGIDDERLLDAFRNVPREEFLPEELAEFAYHDTPLPIAEGQTISQPYIVALTIQSLSLRGSERVLEIGTGSGYAAAILAHVAREVFTVERIEALAEEARGRLERLGRRNVHVLCGDGTLGWPEHAPFDAIAVAAGGPQIPNALRSQMTVGGRMVIPVGQGSSQVLIRVLRQGEDRFVEQELTPVRFVPLIGEQGWAEKKPVAEAPAIETGARAVSKLIHEASEPLDDVDSASIDALVDRIGASKLILLGEATHGTSEFYRMRARITRELIERGLADFVAVEADWPDASRIDDYVLGEERRSTVEFVPFSRFPTWMWRNEETHAFIEWLRDHNLQKRDKQQRVGFHGLDLYSMFTSIAVVLAYLNNVDPEAARIARARYGTLTPWQKDPASYGRAVLVGQYASSENAVVATLRDMLARRLDYALSDGKRFFDAAQNAMLVADAERYYRAMYYGSAASWNLRDRHMFDTLTSLLRFYGEGARGIVWEHNSHVGNAGATEMSARGELNVGQLCRSQFGSSAYLIGFGTDHGTVAA